MKGVLIPLHIRKTAFLFSLILLLGKTHFALDGETGKSNDAGEISKSDTSLEKKMAGFEQFATKIRGLDFKKPVKYASIRKDEIIKELEKKLKEQYSMKEFDNKVMCYVKIGLLKSPEGIRDMMLGMLSEQIAGFYDPETHVLYTLSDLKLDPQFNAMIYIHELTHALQDQHFKFDSFGLNNKKNDDKVIATMSLIEGDATLVIMQYFTKYGKLSLRMLAQAVTMDSSKLRAAPYVFQRELMFPYLEGMELAIRLHAVKGWKGIDDAYKQLPTTTEQILHPEKYITNRDDPTEIKMPNIKRRLGRDWEILDDNVMGELNTQILFEIFLGKKASKKPSEGWDGDKYIVLRNKKNSSMAMVWETIWDTEKDAEEFFSAYSKLLDKKYDTISFNRRTEANSFHWHSEKISIITARNGIRVLTIEAPDENSLMRIFEEFKNIYGNAALSYRRNK